MQGLIGPLKELAEFEELCKNKKKDVGMIRVCGCVNSQKSHMMYAFGDGCKYKVIACSSEAKAKQIYEEYRFSSEDPAGIRESDDTVQSLCELVTETAVDG